jgi:hypothetical protein
MEDRKEVRTLLTTGDVTVLSIFCSNTMLLLALVKLLYLHILKILQVTLFPPESVDFVLENTYSTESRLQ